MNQNSFDSLGISRNLCRVLDDIGYREPTPIQSQVIPALLQAKDLVGIAQTGTGKTAAFALPLLQRLDEEGISPRPRQPRALILAPTRELALQIHGEFTAFGRHLKLRHAVIFGGVGQSPQVRKLVKGVDILVATPGRLLDLAAQKHVDLSKVSALVLDEADRLLDMGFVRDVKRIVAQTPATRQSLLFSATMPKAVADLSRDILKNPVRVDVSPKQITVQDIEQRIVNVDNSDKQQVLERLLHDASVSRAIVFMRTKHGADRVTRKLNKAGIGAEAIHGNKSQNARQRALQNFKNGDTWVLVATDIAARGIDIDAVSHVINHELPHEPESYVHRIGRTGRAGSPGVAWSLVDSSERGRLRAVEKLIRFSPTELEVQLPPREPEQQRNNGNAQTFARDRRPDYEPSNHEASGGSRRPRRRRRRRAA